LYAARSRHEKAVCLSVCLFCPFVCQTRDLCPNERKFCPHSCTSRKTIYPRFMTRKMSGRGGPLLSEIMSQIGPVGAKIPIFNRYSLVAPFQIISVKRLVVAKTPCDCSYSICARSASAVRASEKSSINTNRKSTTHFPVNSIRWP